MLMCKRIFANQTSEQGDVPFYKIGTIGAEPDAYISRELFEEYKAKYNYPRKGEVMVTCAGTVGKTTVFDGKDSYYQDSNIVWLSNPKQLYLNSFLNYFLSRVNWIRLELDNSDWMLSVRRGDIVPHVLESGTVNAATLRSVLSELRYQKEDTVLCEFLYEGEKPGSRAAYQAVQNALHALKADYPHLYISETDISPF